VMRVRRDFPDPDNCYTGFKAKRKRGKWSTDRIIFRSERLQHGQRRRRVVAAASEWPTTRRQQQILDCISGIENECNISWVMLTFSLCKKNNDYVSGIHVNYLNAQTSGI
jgi:hypothetical protein